MLKTYLFVFGIVVVAAGVQGFLKGSKASLIAAGALGALILIGAYLLGEKPTVGFILALVGALGIAGRFIPAFLKASDKAAAIWPAGVMAILSVIALVLIAKAWLKL